VKSLSGTPFENSFLDQALKRHSTGDDLYDLRDDFVERWHREGEVDGDGRLLHDRRFWGITWDEFGLTDVLDCVVESYRRDMSVIEMLRIVAENGEPFPEDREAAGKALKDIASWGDEAIHSRSVGERLDPDSPFVEEWSHAVDERRDDSRQ
jgi:hypothetical protein